MINKLQSRRIKKKTPSEWYRNTGMSFIDLKVETFDVVEVALWCAVAEAPRESTAALCEVSLGGPLEHLAVAERARERGLTGRRRGPLELPEHLLCAGPAAVACGGRRSPGGVRLSGCRFGLRSRRRHGRRVPEHVETVHRRRSLRLR